MHNLNQEQKKAVLSENKHTMVLAGAGTGKTKTIIHKIIHLIEKNKVSSKIAVLTFTRKAANEIVHRLYARLGVRSSSVFASTFHQFCLFNIRKYDSFFGLQAYRIIDAEDQRQLIKYARANTKLKIKNSEILQLISYARNSAISIPNYLEKFPNFAKLDFEEINAEIIQVYEGYKKEKQKMKYLDFDDILVVFSRKLQENEKFRQAISQSFKNFLVDEMQDTNPIQWKILESLSPYCSLFCVGDDAQSIYMFRGADFRNVQHFTNRLSSSELLHLNENFRSTQEILDFTNWLLEQSELPYNKKLKAFRGSGFKPQLHDFFNEWDEAEWISEQLIKNTTRDYRLYQQMVLVRSAWNARKLEIKLIEKDVPYTFIGGINLMSSAHVKDLLSLLQSAILPQDNLAWLRYLTLWQGIGIKGAQNIYQEITTNVVELGKTTTEVVELLVKKYPKNPKIAEFIDKVFQKISNPKACIESAVNLLETLLAEKYDNWDLRKKDFELLINIASKYTSLQNFLDTYALEPIFNDRAGNVKDRVILITVHSAKGLEASICYLMKVQPLVYPHQKSMGDYEKEEEERRILYVAMTRAKNELYISRSFENAGYFAIVEPSRDENRYFLENVPPELVDHHRHFRD